MFDVHPGDHELRALEPVTQINSRGPKIGPVKGTALYAAALGEITRLETRVEHLEAENRLLKSRLALVHDRAADMRHDYLRGDLD